MIEGILNYDQVGQFENQVNDIHDLNRFATFVQWLGCVLSVLLILPVFLPSVSNRIIHPENTRKFERFRDNQDKLIAPLQEFVNPQKNNKHNIK